jgi:hypothetical protein
MANFLLGGRMGDLIHALWVVKNTPGMHEIYITDRRDLHSDGFVLSLDKTRKELDPIIHQQEYCDLFEIYDNQEVINLSLWRRYAYSTSWTQLLSNTFGPEPNGDAWVRFPRQTGWENKIVIHSSTHHARRGHNWQMVLDMYEHRTVFVGNEDEHKAFGFTIPFYKPRSLYEYFIIINSCKFFIGNQSMPLAIAHSLGTPRLAMLNEVDKIHYVGEEKWHKNFYWIAENEQFFEGINY